MVSPKIANVFKKNKVVSLFAGLNESAAIIED